jgi:hypothetical protein
MLSDELTTVDLKKQDATALLTEALAEIKEIRKDIARIRKSGEKVKSRLNRKLQKIQATIGDLQKAI